MPLNPGTRLGPYEIVAPLGAGGMGEVYRARDTRLGRDVAIKVLPQHLSTNPEVRTRFEREAKTISSLNHPNICTLFDVGREGDTDFLVMELVEGETLAARLAKGALPMPDLLRVAGEIADALDRAHRAGVIHRDLKPGNVMLTKSGAKLMDFGLARATGLAGPAGGSGVTVAALTQSPTVAAPLTAEGSIIGTFQFMAPEQLEGREADARSDLWAFGCLLYEMATARRAFDGKSQASLIAAILEREPPAIASVVPLAPPGLDQLVRACLAKDPEQRLQTAHDAKLQLKWIAEGGSQAGVPAPIAARRRGRERLAWIIAVVLGVATIALALPLVLRRNEPPRMLRFSVGQPEGATGMTWPRMSPDGRVLAFLAADSTGTSHIWVRPLDALEAHALTGASGDARPFWSPDSRYLAFIQNGKLRKIPISGGPNTVVCDAPGGWDGSWGSGEAILFDGGPTDSIRWVPSTGGLVKPATRIDHAHGEIQHGWPFFLPDGKHFLFVAYKAGEAAGYIRFARLGSLDSKVVGRTDGRVEYALPGYLIYPSGGTLFAQAFDAGAGKVAGEPLAVGENVALGGGNGDFSVSRSGVISYRAQAQGNESHVMWVDRQGRELSEAAPPAAYHDIALSPDGTRLALCIQDPQNGHDDVWVRDLKRGVTTRLTFEPSDEIWPVWSPDGKRIAYASNRTGDFRILVRSASGIGAVDSMVKALGNQGPTDWSRDGRTMVSASFGSLGWDIFMQPAEGKENPRIFLQTPFNERSGRLSPDGRWLAYSSDESGSPEIYAVPVGGEAGKWQISSGGGIGPQWSADGKEIFYRGLNQTIWAVPVTAGRTLELGNPKALFRADVIESGFAGTRWCPSADGRRFLVNKPTGNRANSHLIVVTDWTAELKKR